MYGLHIRPREASQIESTSLIQRESLNFVVSTGRDHGRRTCNNRYCKEEYSNLPYNWPRTCKTASDQPAREHCQKETAAQEITRHADRCDDVRDKAGEKKE